MDRFVPRDDGNGGWIASYLAMTGKGMDRFVPRDDGGREWIAFCLAMTWSGAYLDLNCSFIASSVRWVRSPVSQLTWMVTRGAASERPDSN